jgi:hypothetical protein
MDERTYQQGIAVLSMSGLKIDEASVEFFWQRLRKMNGDDFLDSIDGLINDPDFKTWYGNENVPLLVIEKHKELKTERNKLRRKQADKQRKLEWEKNASPPPKGFKLPDFYANQVPQLKGKNVGK